jgi:hypothetical protein
MTHASLLNATYQGPHRGPKCNCWCEVRYAGTTVHSGTEWIVFHCAWCKSLIYTIGGNQHWRNHERAVADVC